MCLKEALFEPTNARVDMIFPTASVFKIPVIIEFYGQVDDSRVKLDDQIIREKDKVTGSYIFYR